MLVSKFSAKYILSFKVTTILLCLLFCFGQEQVNAQEKKYLSLNDILANLTFTSQINKSAEKINEELITEVKQRQVNFILDADKEKSLKKAGANKILIETIRENLPKELKEKISLYQNFVKNFDDFAKHFDTNEDRIKLAEKSIFLARLFLDKFGDDKENSEITDYLKNVAIPYLKKQIPKLKEEEKIAY